MKRFIAAALLLAVLSAAAAPAAAQAGPRVTPVVINASENDSFYYTYAFQADMQIVVNGVNTATTEVSEPAHTCISSVGSRSVWFFTWFQPGTVTLSTAGSALAMSNGSTSYNTVISLYRATKPNVSSFADLAPVACNANGTGSGAISNYAVPVEGLYFVQVSIPPGTVPTGSSSQYTLTVTADYATPHPYDEPKDARKLKFPSMPGIVHFNMATRELDEPLDPLLSEPISNTVWFKFTINSARTFAFLNAYPDANRMWFSLFRKSGPDYIPADGLVNSDDQFMSALIDPGTYYLRIGLLGDRKGANDVYGGFNVAAYLNPTNFEFAVDNSEGQPGATPSLAGWTVKKGDPGAGGDGAMCDTGAPHNCYFQFTSSGASEKTALKSATTLNATKLKKGDAVQLSVKFDSLIGMPKFDVVLKLSNAAGVSQKFVMKVRSDLQMQPLAIFFMPKTMAVTKRVITIKNKDTVAGNRVRLDYLLAPTLRFGEGVMRGAPAVPMPLGGGLSPAWQAGTGTSPDGVLPAPPPPAN